MLAACTSSEPSPRPYMPTVHSIPLQHPCVVVESLAIVGDTVQDVRAPEPMTSMRALADSITYSEIAVEARVTGRVAVQFVVDAEGRPDSVRVVRGVGARLDEEVVHVLKSTTFTPGRRDDQLAPIPMRLDVMFQEGGCSE